MMASSFSLIPNLSLSRKSSWGVFVGVGVVSLLFMLSLTKMDLHLNWRGIHFTNSLESLFGRALLLVLLDQSSTGPFWHPCQWNSSNRVAFLCNNFSMPLSIDVFLCVRGGALENTGDSPSWIWPVTYLVFPDNWDEWSKISKTISLMLQLRGYAPPPQEESLVHRYHLLFTTTIVEHRIFGEQVMMVGKEFPTYNTKWWFLPIEEWSWSPKNLQNKT